jgi:Lar family restriction alleviation protein
MELLPCPFCGSKDVIIEVSIDTTGIYVECLDCGNRTAQWLKEETAMKKWNSRNKSKDEYCKCPHCQIYFKADHYVEKPDHSGFIEVAPVQ